MRPANVILTTTLGLIYSCPAGAFGRGLGSTVVTDELGGTNAFRVEHHHDELHELQRQRSGEESQVINDAIASMGNTNSRGRGSYGASDGDGDVGTELSGAKLDICSGAEDASDPRCHGEEGIASQYHQQRRSRSEHDAIAVEIGEYDGIRIEFAGKAEGTIPKRDLRQQQQHHRLSSSSVSRANPNTQAEGADQGERLPAEVEVEMRFELLKCDGESYRNGSMDGDLTVKGVYDHMLTKLYDSAQQPATASRNEEEGADGCPGEGSAGSNFATRIASWGGALEAAAAPFSYLFGTVGSVPGWFSDAVFEVRVKDDMFGSDLPQRLILVQKPSRVLRLACSVLAPLLVPPAEAPAGSSTGSGASNVPGVIRTICHTTSPFPGKEVSRPCRLGAAPSKGWMPNVFQAMLSWFDPGLDGIRDTGSSDDGGFATEVSTDACECAEGGRGPCTIRTVPGRDPCLYLETSEATKGFKRGGSSRDGRREAFVPGSTDTSSVMQLRTFSVVMPTATSKALAIQGQDDVDEEGLVARMLSALQRVVVKRALPASVVVPTFVARLLAGVALLFVARPLSESRVFHYVLAALLGAVLGAVALILRVLGNPRRGLLRILLVLGLVTWLAVAVGDMAPSPAELLSRLPGMMLAFWNNGCAGYPSMGKVFFGASGLVGVAITKWYGLFLDEGAGARESWCTGQECIRRVLTLSGLLLLYYGVSDSEIGAVLVILALSAPSLAHLVRRYSMWTHRSKWYRAGRRLTQTEYEEEGDEYTRSALAALRHSAMQNNPQIRRLKNQASRRRMSAFARTGEHYETSGDDDNRRQPCSLM